MASVQNMENKKQKTMEQRKITGSTPPKDNYSKHLVNVSLLFFYHYAAGKKKKNPCTMLHWDKLQKSLKATRLNMCYE